jgi:beta-lactamase regulating signal transducer with metallopeptidase domain
MTGALLDHLWQSTLFCGGVWLLTFGLRANSAALRHWLWLLASLKFLVPFSALYTVGALAGLPPPVEVQPDFFVFTAAAPMLSPTSVLTASANSTSQSNAVFELLLLAIWLVGAAIVALRWFFAWSAANRISRAARPAPGAPPDALVTDAHIEPSAAGVIQPVVLLPSALLGKLTAPQLQAVLAHEREHISRHDNLKANFHRIVEMLFWFYPLIWWIGRRMLEERERACDEAVIETGHDPADYAAGILAVCRHCCAHGEASHTPSAIAGDLTQRIRQILGCARPHSLGFLKACALTACTLVVATVPVFAGAFDHALQRYHLLRSQADALGSADVSIAPAAADVPPRSINANGKLVEIRNSSLRDLVAIAYGVESSQVVGFDSTLDDLRYDVRARLPQPVSEPEHFDPLALQATVTKLLAGQFGLEIHVNRQCQNPCGRYASIESADSR